MNKTAIPANGRFNYRTIPFYVVLIAVLFLGWSPAISLLLGLVIGIFFIQPNPKRTRTITKYLLQFSIVGLGFGMNLINVMKAGSSGFLYTLVSLSFALILGYLLGRWMKLDNKISYLISTGTAICGGSAIAAVSQAMKADEHQVSVSIGIVFILNAVALFVFPFVGHYFQMDQHTFGLWAAIAIHDTSSVVGAATQYGHEALENATTIKLARSLWIIPMTFLTANIFKNKESRFSFPWFILFFLVASAISTYLPLPNEISIPVVAFAKIGFKATLFLIGSGITKQALRNVGFKPMLHGLFLWVVISAISLCLIIGLH